MGDVLDLTDRRVRQLAEEGVFDRVERGQYPLAASVQAYIATMEADESDELRRERIGLMKAQRRRLELDNEFKESTVDEIDWQESVIGVLAAYWHLRAILVSTWLHDAMSQHGLQKDAKIIAGNVHNWMIASRHEIETDLRKAAQEARRQKITIKTFDELARLLAKIGAASIAGVAKEEDT
ncbi:hypothetical protein [Mesorhizobium sp. BR1-1-4]|uniref:hypothetical protein n=1 Tax=Mesorhizobium sp. BR1-1-4 TaxID=2876650 RepID=UPI001CCD483A|nr:hypothetical protein [Mesorhizobium sp. BR1-1-4]MBZ9927757.1 hypothetical protein [Mesorhizobium sp. BR1-1-4]